MGLFDNNDTPYCFCADPTSPINIVLVGPMAAGKSAVGRLLAEQLDMRFLDMDKELEQRAGVDIPTIFEFEGEAGFRSRETRLLKELVTSCTNCVIATGGGTILSEVNRRLLNEAGVVVFLKVSIPEQLRRTRRDRHRPLLQTADRRATLEKLATERFPLYQQVADLAVPTDRKHCKHVAQLIIQQLQQHNHFDAAI